MISRLGIRVRLVAGVTILFALTSVVLAVVLLRVVEDRLVDGNRDDATDTLTAYLDDLSTGSIALGSTSPGETTSFFYLDDEGTELSPPEFAGSVFATPGTRLSEDGPSTLTIEAADLESIDLGSDVTAVGAPVTIGLEQFTIGVSNPLQPVEDSLAAVRTALWFVLPILVVGVAGTAWYVTGRALRPVQAITAEVQEVTDTNIAGRVPVPRAEDEIRRLATTMNDMLDRLEQSTRRQRQLTADASHELRSPVAASRAQLEVALANPDTTDWSTTATAVLTEQQHLGILVDDLLTLSRLEEIGPNEASDVDLDDLVRNEAARPHRSTVRTSVPRPVRVRGNAVQLARALRNLIDNADDHAVDAIRISLDVEDRTATVVVEDDGPGIDEADRDRIFDRFVRLDEARDRRTGGTGLGLAIAREVARAHRGDIAVEGSSLGGAKFTLTLPTGSS